MSCSTYTDFASQPLDCKFPCPCTKCKNKKRLEEMEQKKRTESGTLLSAEEVKTGLDEDGNRFVGYLSNVVNSLVFILFFTCLIWAYVLKWLVKIGVGIYNSDRRTQRILAIFLSLLILSTCLSLLIDNLKRNQTTSATKTNKVAKDTGTTMKPTVKTRDVGTATPKTNEINKNIAIGKTVEINKNKTKSSEPAKKDSVVSWWNWCERKKPTCLRKAYMDLKPKTIKPRSYSSIAIFKKKALPPPVPAPDNRAKEVYDQSKLYAVPMEMKRPPALLAFIFNSISPGGRGDIGNI